jgi:flavin-binding protein dodecin
MRHPAICASPWNSMIRRGLLQLLGRMNPRSQKDQAMAMLKVIEVLAESPEGWEDAARRAVADAAKTVRNIKSIYIKNFEATVDQEKITKYRINAKISFLLE